MSATSSEDEIVAFVKDQLSVTFGNKSLHEEANYDIHISSIFVHATVLTIEEDKSASNYTHGSYDIMFTLRLGEIVDTDRLISVMKVLSGRRNLHINNRSDVYVNDIRIFNDSENILCNLTSYGDCDEATTYCQQRNGTTLCVCKSGFEKRSEADKFCRDINECTNTTYKCLGGRCDNYPGNWSCTCNEKSFVPVRVDDYTLNCTEVHFNACNSYPNFECRNGNRSCINDSWKCNCRKGALAVPETDVLYICEDEDECVIRNNTCSSHGKCKNHANGFTCDCDEGYGRNDTDPFNVTCIDIDECHSPDYSCVNGLCGNVVGNWTCTCNETGFVRKQVTPNAIVCEDIDECKNEHFFCGGECTNSFGSWTCDCTAGFTKYTNNDQITCEDINECDRKDACIDSACKNLDGSWTCLCQDGKEPKKINDSTIACTGGYQYVMSLAFAVTETIGGHENELKMYLQYQITYVYEASFPNSKVRVEIISVSKDNTLRNKRNVENLKVKYVLHLDEQTELTEIKKAWHGYVTQNCTNGMCEQAHEMSAAISFVVLLSDEVAVDDNEGVCALPRYNLCDPHSTQCKYGNGTAKCECSKGFSRKSEYECIVSADACKDLPCGNGGTCRMVNVNKPDMHFECTCAEGWSGLTCTNQHKRLISPQETDIETTFIATGSTLGFLVIIMSVVVLVVCRWRRAKVKEAAKLSKKYADSDDVKPLEGSTNHDRYFNKTYNIFNDSTSENSFRDFDTPHFKGSLPNIMHADAYIYRGDQRRYSFQEKRRYSSYDEDRNVEPDLNFEGNRMSLRHEIERPPSPLPDYNRTSNVDRGGIPTNDNRRSGHFDEFGATIKF